MASALINVPKRAKRGDVVEIRVLTSHIMEPGYRRTAAYGHFGRSEFTWEKTPRAAKMAADLLKGSNGASKSEKKPARKGSAATA